MAKTSSHTFGIEVSLSEKQKDALLAVGRQEGLRDTDVLSGLATGALQDLAGGGAVFSGSTISRLQKFLRDPTNEREILRLVESAAKREGDHTIINFPIDPLWAGPLEDIARQQGRSLHDLVFECLQIAFDQNWAYTLDIPRRAVYLSEEQYDRLRKLLDADQVMGADLVKLVEGRSLAPEPETAFA